MALRNAGLEPNPAASRYRIPATPWTLLGWGGGRGWGGCPLTKLMDPGVLSLTEKRTYHGVTGHPALLIMAGNAERDSTRACSRPVKHRCRR